MFMVGNFRVSSRKSFCVINSSLVDGDIEEDRIIIANDHACKCMSFAINSFMITCVCISNDERFVFVSGRHRENNGFQCALIEIKNGSDLIVRWEKDYSKAEYYSSGQPVSCFDMSSRKVVIGISDEKLNACVVYIDIETGEIEKSCVIHGFGGIDNIVFKCDGGMLVSTYSYATPRSGSGIHRVDPQGNLYKNIIVESFSKSVISVEGDNEYLYSFNNDSEYINKYDLNKIGLIERIRLSNKILRNVRDVKILKDGCIAFLIADSRLLMFERSYVLTYDIDKQKVMRKYHSRNNADCSYIDAGFYVDLTFVEPEIHCVTCRDYKNGEMIRKWNVDFSTLF